MAGRPGRAGGVVQWRATSWRCQRSMVAGVTRSPRRRRTGSCRVRAPSRARSVQLIRGRGMRRWSTASWWRRTRISISLGRRIAPGARSSSGAGRTSRRPAAAPSADHAWTPAVDERPTCGLCARFRASTGTADLGSRGRRAGCSPRWLRRPSSFAASDDQSLAHGLERSIYRDLTAARSAHTIYITF
jgi:hypothetical protein